MKISIVINTINEEKSLPRALKSIKSWADEIVVVDMHSDDDTVKVAKNFRAKVYQHKRTDYVEPARNFAISKATGDWILILDADEEMPSDLLKKLNEISSADDITYVRIPRKNIIFGKWMQHSRWWPDYNIRFFKKGYVKWDSAIHSNPLTEGKGTDLPAEENLAIIHYHYQTVSQYIQRHDRYTNYLLTILQDKGYQFQWTDLLTKPTGEFLSRYLAGEGYKDGLHGLALALLQAFTEFILYLKAWEANNFSHKQIKLSQFALIAKKSIKDLYWWLGEVDKNNRRRAQSFIWRLKRVLI